MADPSRHEALHLLDVRQQIIDNATLLYPHVPLNNFRILTRQMSSRTGYGYHYHAYLMDVNLSGHDDDDDGEEGRSVNHMLLSTEDARGEMLDVPARALAVLLLKTAEEVDGWFRKMAGEGE